MFLNLLVMPSSSSPPKLKISLILSTKPPSFLARAKIPPPASPAKISPAVMFSRIQSATCLTTENTPLNTAEIPSPTAENTPPRPPTPSTTFRMALRTPSRTAVIPLPNDSKGFEIFIFWLIEYSQSPKDAVASRIFPLKPAKFPASLRRGLRSPAIACLPMLRIENNPRKVL